MLASPLLLPCELSLLPREEGRLIISLLVVLDMSANLLKKSFGMLFKLACHGRI